LCLQTDGHDLFYMLPLRPFCTKNA
jgi:hypothetical protein